MFVCMYVSVYMFVWSMYMIAIAVYKKARLFIKVKYHIHNNYYVNTIQSAHNLIMSIVEYVAFKTEIKR